MKHFMFLVRAYQGLKLLLDPAVEGNPYILESNKPKTERVHKPFIFLKRMSWR